MLHKFIAFTGVALLTLSFSAQAYYFETVFYVEAVSVQYEPIFIVYGNGSIDNNDPFGGAIGGGISNDAVNWVQTDDFSIASDTYITGGTVWIESQSGMFDWDGTLEYWFFNNDLGTPGTVLETGAATTIQQTDTGILAQSGEDNIREIIFDLSSDFLAHGEGDYFFGLQLGNNNTAWSGYEPGNSMESFGGTFDNWYDNGRERSFTLRGVPRVIPASSIPEPTPLYLIVFGLISIYFSVRKKNVSPIRFCLCLKKV